MTELLVIGLATSLDRYLWLDRLQTGTVNRPSRTVEQAGGKALHVARAATTLGASVHAVAVVGGHTGTQVRHLADDAPWTTSWVEVSAPTRTCTCVVDESDDTMTEFYEPAPTLSADDWEPILQAIRAAVGGRPDVALVVGQLPGGLPTDAFATVVDCLHDAGVPAVLDSTGPGLALALAASPDTVKVTEREANDSLGLDARGDDAAHTLARALVERGAQHAVVTRGALGAVYAGPDGETLEVVAPRVEPAWPVGSGDSFAAGLALARAQGAAWIRALMQAAGAAAANATGPVAAGFTRTTAERLTAEVDVRPYAGS